MNIAMWSGPRNLSTAMMYAFGNREDCAVWDEPFYGAYLKMSGLRHPMRAQVLASCCLDPDEIARRCAAPAPDGSPIFYQKHMTHQMLGGVDRGWFDHVRHVFLIRHPARVIASYHRKYQNPTPDLLGYALQDEIFSEVRDRLGADPIVIDSADVRARPEATLRALCDALAIPFDPAMLSWPPGPRPEDGVWAAHWYGAVHRSTGFDGAEGPLPEIPDHLAPVLADALPYYERLAAKALVA